MADRALARAAVVVEGTGMGVDGDAALVLMGGEARVWAHGGAACS